MTTIDTKWPVVQLDEVCDILKRGINPQREPSSTFAHYSLPAFDSTAGPQIELGETIKSQKTIIENGVVLVSKLNPRIPRVWLIEDEQKYQRICSTEFVPLRCNTKRLNNSFLAYALRHSLTTGQIVGSTSAATKSRERVRPTDFLRLKVHIPPLEEQRRIVDILARAEGIVRLRREAQKKAEEIIPSLFLDMFGDPATNPKGWPKKPFADVVENMDGKRKPIKASYRSNRKGPYPYYGASGIIDYFDDYLFDGTNLLIAEDGANLLSRSTPIAFLASGKYWVNNHAHVVASNGKANLTFLECLLNQRDLKDSITGSAQPKLNQANLNSILVLDPPIAMQNIFEERVEQMRSIQSQQAAALEKALSMLDALLADAFNRSQTN